MENMRLRSPVLSEQDREHNRMFAKCLLTVGKSTGADDTIDWLVEHVVKDN